MKKEYAIKLVEQEIEKATIKFIPFASMHEGYAIIKEELDELWEDIKKEGPLYSNDDACTEHLRKEAVQVVTMSLRFLIDLC